MDRVCFSGLFGHPLDLFHHPQEIAAGNVTDLVFGIAAFAHFNDDLLHPAHVFQAVGRDFDAIEVAAQAHMPEAHQLHHVVDVIHDLFVGRARNGLLP